VTALTGLLRIALPSHTVLLSDGGVTEFNSETYTSSDSLLGTIASMDIIAEGIGNEIQALDLGFAPPSAVGAASLSSGAIQQSSVQLWVAEYDTSTGLIVGTPDLRFIGFVDQPTVSYALRQFGVDITAVPELEAVFFRDTGNGLSSSFHKSLYAGELGHDEATGLTVGVAWGAASPAGGGGSSSGGGSSGVNLVEY